MGWRGAVSAWAAAGNVLQWKYCTSILTLTFCDAVYVFIMWLYYCGMCRPNTCVILLFLFIRRGIRISMRRFSLMDNTSNSPMSPYEIETHSLTTYIIFIEVYGMITQQQQSEDTVKLAVIDADESPAPMIISRL